MAEYHWNEQPADLLALLDNGTTLPPLDGFEASSFVAPPPLPDIFTSLEPASSLDEPVGAALLQDLQVPDLYAAPEAPKHEDTPVVPLHTAVLPPAVAPVPVPVPAPAPATPPSDGSVELSSERDYSQVNDVDPPSPLADSADTQLDEGGGSGSLSSAASDVTAGVSAVEMARKMAEDFANNKVSERKRRLGRDDGDGKRRKGNDGMQVSDGDEDAPEKVSHRKYQKRLQKNRDSAYVSRIRRREYTKKLEEGLNRVEKEKNELQGRYDALQSKFEKVVGELRAMKEASKARLHSVGKALAGPVGAARTTAKPKGAGALVTTMFMFALIFGFMVPESLTSGGVRSPFSAASGGKLLGLGGRSGDAPMHVVSGKKKEGVVWDDMGPLQAPAWWAGTCPVDAMCSLKENVAALFGDDNGAAMMQQIEARAQAGGMTPKDVKHLAKRSKVMVDHIETDAVRRTLASRRSKLFKAVLRKMAQLADECFTKELVALLTIRMLPVATK